MKPVKKKKGPVPFSFSSSSSIVLSPLLLCPHPSIHHTVQLILFFGAIQSTIFGLLAYMRVINDYGVYVAHIWAIILPNLMLAIESPFLYILIIRSFPEEELKEFDEVLLRRIKTLSSRRFPKKDVVNGDDGQEGKDGKEEQGGEEEEEDEEDGGDDNEITIMTYEEALQEIKREDSQAVF